MSRTTPPFSNSWLFKSIRKHHLRTLHILCITIQCHFKKIAYLSPGTPIRLDITFKIWRQCLFYTSLSYKYYGVRTQYQYLQLLIRCYWQGKKFNSKLTCWNPYPKSEEAAMLVSFFFDIVSKLWTKICGWQEKKISPIEDQTTLMQRKRSMLIYDEETILGIKLSCQNYLRRQSLQHHITVLHKTR